MLKQNIWNKKKEISLFHINNDIRFNLIAVIMIFAIVFLLTETGFWSIVFSTAVFILFIREGINKEMNVAKSTH